MDIRKFFTAKEGGRSGGAGSRSSAKKEEDKSVVILDDDDDDFEESSKRRVTRSAIVTQAKTKAETPRRQSRNRAASAEGQDQVGKRLRSSQSSGAGGGGRRGGTRSSDTRKRRESSRIVVDDDDEEEEMASGRDGSVEEEAEEEVGENSSVEDVDATRTMKRRRVAKSSTTRRKADNVKVENSKPRDEVKPSLGPNEIRKLEPLPVFERPKSVPTGDALWVDKYRPKTLRDLCANPKHATDLMNWLRNWRHVHLSPTDGKKKKPPPGSEKAVLLCGPPGVGKTTLAHVACKELGFEAHEFNASDTRNKGAIHEVVGALTLNESISKFCISSDKAKKRGNGQVLIMDECDGMSAGDRGGMQELIQVIKNGRVPIICIANDDSNPKVRSLANYCLKLKFRRPTAAQVRKRLLDICEAEKIGHVGADVLESISNSCNGDIRQMINLLQGWKARGVSFTEDAVTKNLKSEGKTFETQTIFDLFKVFFENTLPVATRIDRYFMDADLVPLMVQENYLLFQGSSDLGNMVKAADSISEADLGNRRLREDSRWDLMPSVAVMSAVLPGSYVQEIDMRMKTRLSTGWRQLVLDYAPCLRTELSRPIVDQGVDGIGEVIDLLDDYYLSKDDWDSIMDLSSLQANSNPKEKIPSNVKSKFTREYESRSHHASTVSAVKMKKSAKEASAPGAEELGETDVIVEKDEAAAAAGEDEDNIAEEDDGDLGKDNMVKVGKKPGGTAKKKAGAAGGRSSGSRRGRAAKR